MTSIYSTLGSLYQKGSRLYLENPMQLCEGHQDNVILANK